MIVLPFTMERDPVIGLYRIFCHGESWGNWATAREVLLWEALQDRENRLYSAQERVKFLEALEVRRMQEFDNA